MISDARLQSAVQQQSRTVLNLERKWFETLPWETVVKVNKELCEKDGQPHGPNAGAYDQAVKLWEQSSQRPIKLRDALEVFRQIHKLGPFQFFNGNTVAAVAKLLVTPVLDPLPSVQSQIARSTVSHYVVGAIKARELEDVFGHFNQLWSK